MTVLPWNSGIIEYLASIRVDWLTQIFVAITFLGNEMGYILIVAFIYWLFNKKLGKQLVIAVVLTSFINHTLKILIRNPRPFVEAGTHEENWAIPEGDFEETSHSFSTPSGHAQGSSTFWWYLHLKVKSRLTFVLLPMMVLLIGLSRPYLGVHFLEDIIIGWVVGFIIVVFIYRYDDRIENWWGELSVSQQLLIAIVPSVIISILAGLISNYSVDGEQYVTLSAIFSGIVLGSIIDSLYINYNPSLRSYNSIGQKILISTIRMVLGLLIVGIFLIGLEGLFDTLTADTTPLGFMLRWLRYTSLGLAAIVVVPYLFIKLQLVEE